MITAKSIQAIALPASAGPDVILVQEGDEWNGMVKFKAIAPPDMDGQILIASREEERAGMAGVFGRIFQGAGGEKWLAVRASPGLAPLFQKQG